MSRQFSLGRIDAGRADILLSGSTISGKHAEFIIENNGALLIRDLSSSNGTVILRSGKKLPVTSSTVSLNSSDVVSLGGNEFTVETLLAKLPSGGGGNVPKRAPSTPYVSSQKMMRCSSCGSVTPLGHACVECGYNG